MVFAERVAALQSEYAKGRAALADIHAQRRQLDAQESALTLTLARIEGALSILSELSGDAQTPTDRGLAPSTRP